MNHVHQRVALLTGVSVSAFALATPAAAATVAGIQHVVTAPNVDDTLTICAIGDTCASGVSNSGSGLVSSSVTDAASGGIVQVGIATAPLGKVSLDMTNSGDATIAAIATASAAGGVASAIAFIQPAIAQTGQGGGDVALSFANDGSLAIDAAAIATGTNPLAAATVFTAIHQFANSTGTGDASAIVANSGTLAIGATAAAHGSTGATAVADIYHGVGNFVSANNGDALASVVNVGDVAVVADASATVHGTNGTAYAAAFVGNAIEQTGYAANRDVTATIDNSGTIEITAGAYASGVATAPLGATAAVLATAQAYNSYAIDQTGSAASGDVALGFTNSGTVHVGVHATAVAAASGSGAAGTAFASAYMHDPLYQKAYAPGGDIAIDATNSGEFDVAALAAATGANAIAEADVEYGISQYATAGGDANVSLVNSGLINETVAAAANGTAGIGFGLAVLTSAVFQLASAAGDASVDFANSGTLNALATADANGQSGAGAGAFLDFAINQIAIASGTAAAAMTNDGTINLDAAAAAHAASGRATGIAFVSHAISQHAYGVSAADVALTNSGDISIVASGNATADSNWAFGEAAVFRGIYQSAYASGAATASFDNSGTLEVIAKAHGDGGQVGRAIAVVAPAVFQIASGGTASLVHLDNSGTINVAAIAEGTGTVGAPVLAGAFGIIQDAGAGTAEFVNSGEINIFASGHAVDTGRSAFVGVSAAGLVQHGAGGIDRFDNSGSIHVEAIASAEGSGGFVGGSATGYAVIGSAAMLDVDNSGTLDVAIKGVAPEGALVAAIGMSIQAQGTFATTFTVPVEQARIAGTITNSGQINVAAVASGGTVTFGSGSTAVTTPGSGAFATAIRMDSGVNTATIDNSGSINVEAVTANGGQAVAKGIVVTGNGTGVPAGPDDVFTVNNSGNIIVRYSTDGGTTFHRGTAIDVTAAPNASVINLLSGNVVGDINVQAGDAINVTGGKTNFNGVINASCYDATAIAAGGDNPALSSCGVGTLTIGSGGNLHMTISPTDGPSYAFVDTLTVGSTGTLTLDLPAVSGAADPGSYPQIFADTANLDGTLVANIQPANGLFATSSYDNVIDANSRNGTFDTCALGGPYTGSVLLSLSCSYDNQANVDLALTRIAFDAVPGLNANGVAVGSGLECICDVGLTGGAQAMFHDLFLFSSDANYNVALNELSGSAYANYLNSFPSLGVHYDDVVDHATDCRSAVAGSVLECRDGSPIHLWGQLDYQWRKAGGDSEAGSSKTKRLSGLVGVDAAVGTSAILGIEAGYVTNHLRDRQFGDSVKADGYQLGAYAVYDPGAFFVKGVTTYNWYDGDSARHINFAPLAAGATFAGTPAGDPDVNMWTVGLHGGARLAIGRGSVVTPYVNYDYVHAHLKGFSETGLAGADLTVEGSSSSHSFLAGGIKWAGQFGGVVPQLDLGYRYRFGNSRSFVGAYFNGDTDCDFSVESASQKRGTFLAGLSLGGKVGPVGISIGYQGEFNRDVTSHSGNFKIVLPLGGHHAAAPPPPPPPPPAPVAAEPAPVEAAPPPPPPPPTQRGERGE